MDFSGAVTHQLVVWLDGETHDALHIDVTVRDWRDMRQMLSWVEGRIGLNFGLHRRGIPSQHDVGEQGEGPADGVRIILGSAMLGLDPSGQQCALQGMERLSMSLEHSPEVAK